MSTSVEPVKLDYLTPPESVYAPVKPRRLNYGDPLRILGTIAVVIGHNADMAMNSDLFTHQWRVVNFWDAFTRWAVPVYIMLSGALLLEPSRKEDAGQFYKKRLARIGVPLVVWTAFFMWFDAYYTKWRTPAEVWRLLALGKPYTHLHFIFRIAGLYFFTPMMRIWLRHTDRKMQWHAVIGALALASADSIMNGITGNEPSAFARFVPFIGYYLLGYLIRDVKVSKLGLAYCWIGAIGCGVLLATGTEWLIAKFPNPKDSLSIDWYPSIQMILYDFVSPIRIIMAVCVWLIFVNGFRNPWPHSERGRKVLAFWASTTLGLYLIHPMFREILYTGKLMYPAFSHGHLIWVTKYMHQTFGPTWHGVWIGIPVVAAMIYLLSLVSTIILMKIPGVRRITG